MSEGQSYLDGILELLRQGKRIWRRGDNVLGSFGYVRRRQTAIDLINEELEARGMYTIPTLTVEMPLNSAIRFRLNNAPEEEAGPEQEPEIDQAPVEELPIAAGEDQQGATVIVAAEPPSADLERPADRALIVANLACAERKPETINPDATIKEALTVMDLKDYSQLVVVGNVRDIRGIISYKSVARAFLHGSPTYVRECIDPSVPRVELNAPLLDVVSLFWDHDAVLVMAVDKTLSGIVTPSDIAVEFGGMAGPFLLIGQMEEQLR